MGSTSGVDWAEIDAEIADVPEEFREPRFYPLKHVVEIFSSDDPQGLTAEVGALGRGPIAPLAPVSCVLLSMAVAWGARRKSCEQRQLGAPAVCEVHAMEHPVDFQERMSLPRATSAPASTGWPRGV